MIVVLGTLGGVALGFFLQSFSQKRRDKALLTKKRVAIESELGTNAALISERKTSLLEIQCGLRKGNLLRSSIVRFPMYCYLEYIGEVSVSLTSRQRENLVAIYETLRITDEYMDRLHSEYMKVKQSRVFSNINKSYIEEIGELLNQCSRAEMLIKKYLAGEPMKIVWGKLPPMSKRVKDIPKEE